ncbi:hypothetical protein M422DRAFT_60684 [Sphaerobolus stellatus SS14]|uniref:Unplaced genomic scaffold SPHSTscaffold_75, whole genome shotgun sequence n=1 Tax=Sphaerobolus stellatus (strain SS14) TaxID=990650 RepID=A0A0C9VE86_SPHS4|nr:hypothetical protein M422DRAFT_60684 [Sphaerobolus stellatus SS14]
MTSTFKDEKVYTEKVEEASSDEDERRLVKKLDRRILPIMCLLYLFAYLDRTNLGNARLQGLPQDILGGDPTGKLFDWVNSAFFFSYILCQVPATIIMKLFNPRIWMGCVAIGWSICSILMSTGFSFAGTMICRIGLGVFEAGFSPSIPIYFSLFYTKAELGLRLAHWFGFAAVAGAFGGLIAFGIQQADLPGPLHDHNWRLLFIVEGLPAFVLGIVTIFLLPARPESTRFFKDGPERDLAIKRANRGTTADIGYVIKKEHIKLALTDWKVYIGGVIYFGLNVALVSISAFLPTIIQANAQLLTVPPYACAAIVLTITAWMSDRLQSRGIACAISSAVAGIGYILLLTVPDKVGIRYLGVFFITSGTYTHIGVTIAWFAHNLGSETKKSAGLPMFMAIGQCGSVLGSHIFPSTEGPRYIKGFGVSCALQFLASLCAAALSIHFRHENKRRDRVYGRVDPNEKVDTRELADKAENFRYIP